MALLLNPYGRPSGSGRFGGSNKALHVGLLASLKMAVHLHQYQLRCSWRSEWIDAHEVTVVTNNGKALLLEDIDLSIITYWR